MPVTFQEKGRGNCGLRISNCGFIFGFRIFGLRRASCNSWLPELPQKFQNPQSGNKSAIRNPQSAIPHADLRLEAVLLRDVEASLTWQVV
jgi:hypothetical protein